jgi:pseudouridine-5'-phosphate glycosidase
MRYIKRMDPYLRQLLRYSQETAQALREKRPVVALESTVIAHGLPHPTNLEVAARMEEIVRKRGATPATIAVLDGTIHIGLTDEERKRVGTADNIAKASLRDLPVLLAKGGNGATTVSATAFLASQAGIKVFATGGIGGVHRGWESTMDISPDLPALASTPIVTVCAGAKSVLDIPATLEWLETNGVSVLGYRTDRFPAFYIPVYNASVGVDARVDTPEEVAKIFKIRTVVGLKGGLLVCAPIPTHAALTKSEVEEAIEAALKEAEEKGIKGREVTPYLLSALGKSTGGRTLSANRSLLENNAGVAADISKAITPAEYA